MKTPKTRIPRQKTGRLTVMQRAEIIARQPMGLCADGCQRDAVCCMIVFDRPDTKPLVGEWRAFCRKCWGKRSAPERMAKAAKTRDFKARQMDLLDKLVEPDVT